MQQFRVVYRRASGAEGVCFVDAKTEEGARAFFKQAWGENVEIITLAREAVDPCAKYERRPVTP